MRRTLLALTAAGALITVGCGSSETPDASTVAGEPAGRPDDDAQLAFSRCMRENGVKIEDARPGSGRGEQRVRIGRGVSPQVLERATKECREKTGGGPPELTPEQREEFRDQALEFARCMRENGVDMPDPQVSGSGGVLMRARRGSFNPDSPAFQRAEEACRDKRPGIRREEGQ